MPIKGLHERRESYRPSRYRPYGNPGPGLLAVVKNIKKDMAIFSWNRQSQRGQKEIVSTLSVPIDEILNVSAYHPGDFKRFYDDPRSRAEYAKWGYQLLAAEEYHAGNFKIGTPSKNL